MKYKTLHLLSLFAVITAVFASSLQNDFVWDDKVFLVGNRIYRDFDIGRILFSLANGLEHLPVRDISFALDFFVWGAKPFGFHLTNLVLSFVNAVAIYFFTDETILLLKNEQEHNSASGILTVPFLTALFFVVHPINNEAVYFITCRNVLLSALFFFLSLYLYVKFLRGAESRRWVNYCGALSCYILAIFSKATSIILPLILLVLILVSRHRVIRQRLLETVPFFLVSAGAFFLFRGIAINVRLIRESRTEPLLDNLAVALQIPFFYLQKLFVPLGYSSEYGIEFPHSFSEPIVLISLAALTVMFLLALGGRLQREFTFSFFWFMIALIPVLHIFPTYPIVADRFAYLPSYGIFFIAATCCASCLRGKGRKLLFR